MARREPTISGRTRLLIAAAVLVMAASPPRASSPVVRGAETPGSGSGSGQRIDLPGVGLFSQLRAPNGDRQAAGILPGDPHTYDNEILYAAESYAQNPDPLFPLVIKAIIQVESNFDPSARGDPETCQGRRDGDCGPYRGDESYAEYASIGLMQYNRLAHTDGRGDLRDPGQNILASVEILDVCWRLYAADYQAAIRCYNGNGPGSYAYVGRVVTVLRPLAQAAGLADIL